MVDPLHPQSDFKPVQRVVTQVRPGNTVDLQVSGVPRVETLMLL